MFCFSKGKPKTANRIKDRKNIHENVVCHGTWRQKDGTLKPSTSKGRFAAYGIRFNIWHIPPCVSRDDRNGHPAAFPLRLAKDHILSWSNEGDTVFDPFLGSGTTRIAAYDLRRSFIGCEISKEYFEAQERRFAEHTAQTRMF